ncbi:2937_t:CDS:2, partial [Paraglomus occultum]
LDLQHSVSYFPLPDLTGGDRSKSGEETEEESIGSVDDEDLEEVSRQEETGITRRARKEGVQGVKFYPIALEEPLPISVWQPRPNEKDDLHMRVVINTAELANLGCLSGSWALICNPLNQNSKTHNSRLCQVYGAKLSKTHSPPLAYMTPLLYFNLGLNEVSSSNKMIVIKPMSKPQDPPPVADSVVVARVASPATSEPIFLSALYETFKRWFVEAERVVCEGDIVSIPFDEETVRLRPKKQGSEDLEEIQIPTAPSQSTTVLHFKITEVKSSVKTSRHRPGRRINQNKTLLNQAGLEHSRVPSIRHYYNIKSDAPLCPGSGSPLTSRGTPYSKLYDLVSSCLDPKAASLNLTCTVLVHGPRGCGKKTVVEWVAESVGVHLYEVNCFDFAGESDTKTEQSIRSRFNKALTYSPCIFLLKHIDALARKSVALETGQEPKVAIMLQGCFKQLLEAFRRIGHPVLVVGTTGDYDKIPASVVGCFRHEVVFEAPEEQMRLAMLQQLTKNTPLAPDVSLRTLATQTAALVAKDLAGLVARAGLAANERIDKAIRTSGQNVDDTDIIKAGITLTMADFDTALGQTRASYSDSIGAPKIPNVTWDDVGGLAEVKSDILDTIQLPLEHPELFATGMKKRTGILLYGPPGTGKTLLAKAVATSCSLNFFSVKGPELLNMYIGESEANVRRVFQRARDARPCVIFFDELDSVAPKRGEKGDSGGVMDRIVSQLLAELDGMGQAGSASDVFVIGATNRPDLLDPALLRPGRFDKLLYLGVNEDHEQQLKVIQALTRKFRLHPSLELRKIAENCPFNYTGADFYALCSDAMLNAMS